MFLGERGYDIFVRHVMERDRVQPTIRITVEIEDCERLVRVVETASLLPDVNDAFRPTVE